MVEELVVESTRPAESGGSTARAVRVSAVTTSRMTPRASVTMVQEEPGDEHARESD